MKEMGSHKWKNWSGSLRFEPSEILAPESEEEIQEIVQTAIREHRKLRVVGAGHSSSPLVETEDFLVSLENFKGVEGVDLEKNQAVVLGGMTVKEAGQELDRFGLAMHNTGDVDVQTLAGAIGTGTHGTGEGLQNLSAMLIGVRMLTGTGEIIEVSKEEDEELFQVLQVALGTCGIFLKMRLQLQPTYQLHRKEWCVPIEKCLAHLDELREENRNFDFYWYPRSELAKIRVMNKLGDPMPEIPYGTLELDKKGHSHIILPRKRDLKFDEMEYALPAASGLACFQEVREQVKKKFRKDVAWRTLYRTVKEDNAVLSPMYRRETVTISLHQNAGLPFQEYFGEMEKIFRRFGGRPHWGKKHNLKAAELKELYPEWNQISRYRRDFDPHDVFLTPYMKELLIP